MSRSPAVQTPPWAKHPAAPHIPHCTLGLSSELPAEITRAHRSCPSQRSRIESFSASRAPARHRKHRKHRIHECQAGRCLRAAALEFAALVTAAGAPSAIKPPYKASLFGPRLQALIDNSTKPSQRRPDDRLDSTRQS